MLSKLEPHRKLLLQAADYIREHGHCRGTMLDPQGRVCLLGAIFFSSEKGSDVAAAYDAFAKYVGMGVVTYNETHCYSAEIAINALENAALANVVP